MIPLQNEGSTTWSGEKTVKLWVKNESWAIPRNCDLALPIDLCTILCVNAHFFTTKEHLQKCASVSWNLAVTSWNVLSQGIGAHILFPSWSSFWVLKNKFLWFSHRNTELSLYVWSQKIVTKGALYFQFLDIPTNNFQHDMPIWNLFLFLYFYLIHFFRWPNLNVTNWVIPTLW